MKLLSIFKGFFQGGSPAVHTQVIKHLETLPDFENTALSLSSKSEREFTVQYAEDSYPYRELQASGVKVELLDRFLEGDFTEEHRAQVQALVDEADALFLLKEQVLPALRDIDLRGKPLIVALHRSDPENQGEGLQDLVDLDNSHELSLVISCAHSATEAYAAVGVTTTPRVFVHNGVDLELYSRSEIRRKASRLELGIPQDAPTVLVAARFDPMKNLPGFVEAAGEFLNLRSDAHFILCGAGLSEDNPELSSLIETHARGFEKRFHRLGISSRMAELYETTDIVALTSTFGEAAPLCLLEGMASGAIPVTTPVGDSAALVRHEKLVTSFDPAEIAQVWDDVFTDLPGWRSYLAAYRSEISIEAMNTGYEVELRRVLGV